MICNMGMPLNCITLTSQLIDHPESLLELFDTITNKRVFRFNHTCTNRLVDNFRYFSSWFEPTSLNRAAEWVVAEFEQRITRA